MQGLRATAGFITVLGVLLSLFVYIFGWYVIPQGANAIWFTALGGNQATVGNSGTYFNFEHYLVCICGIISIIGGILALTRIKNASLTGGILIILGAIGYLILLMVFAASNLGPFISNISNPFFGDVIVGSDHYTGYLGIGWYMVLIGGILAIISGSKED